MNVHAVAAIYRFEMARTWRTITQSIVSPVLSTALYFVVFGSAIGSRIERSATSPTAPSSCPGLIMLSVLTQSISERIVRHLLPEVHRHDLRAALGADLARRDRAELRRRRGDQVGAVG
jgi:ABC-2 type transport system permease protein